MAAVAIRGVTQRLLQGNGMEARLSLARTAKLLIEGGEVHFAAALASKTSADLSPTIEATHWGQAQRLNPPITIDGTRIR
jgi:hypothetical protein